MRNSRWASLLLISAITVGCIIPLPAQSTGGGQTGGGSAGGAGTGGAGGTGTGGTGATGGTGGQTRPPISQPTPGTQPRDQFPQMDMPRPVFLSGKVVTDDGTPPPDPAVIELLCGGGQPKPQGYTNSKGQFSFQLGQNQALFADASQGNMNDGFGPSFGRTSSSMPGSIGGSRGISERDLMGCELRAALPGYLSTVVQLSGRRNLDNPDVGTILLKRLGNVEGFTYSMTTANAPKDARKAYEKAMNQAKKNKLPDAEVNLKKAVGSYPKYSVAWLDLGRVLEAQKKLDEAKEAYLKAAEADPKFVNPQLQLMGLAGKAANWPDVLSFSEKVIRLNPVNFPQAWFYNSVANYNLGKREEAEKSAREALKLDPNHRIPKVSHLLGIILAEKRDYPSALEHFKGYLTASPNAPDAATVKQQVSELEKIVSAAPAPPK